VLSDSSREERGERKEKKKKKKKKRKREGRGEARKGGPALEFACLLFRGHRRPGGEKREDRTDESDESLDFSFLAGKARW